MSEQKVVEAQLLFDNKFYATSYYLAGYAIEFALKSTVCEILGLDVYLDIKMSNNLPKGTSEHLKRSLSTHNIADLMVLSGLHQKFNQYKEGSPDRLAMWSIIADWKVEDRYNPECSEEKARTFIKTVTSFQTWILQN